MMEGSLLLCMANAEPRMEYKILSSSLGFDFLGNGLGLDSENQI